MCETAENTFHDKLHGYLSTVLHSAIAQAFTGAQADSFPLEEIYKVITLPPKEGMGHYAFPCFILAKHLKMNPAQCASSIAEKIVCDQVLAQASASGPYINMTVTPTALGSMVVSPISGGIFFSRQLLPESQKIMLEYSQPNTHKVLHVGHMRNLCLGNALVNILRYAGHDVVSVTYPGDVGTHVAKCLWYIKQHGSESPPAEGKGEWLGSIYVKAVNKLDEEKDTEKGERNNSQLSQILKEIHDQSGEYYDLWRETRQWSIELMRESYNWAGVDFDHWFWESEVDATSLEYARELQAEGKLVEDDGAVGMDLSDDGLGFCILIKRDGTGLYATKDIALAKKKFSQYKIDKSIYIVDNRQSHHFKQVFKVLQRLGFKNAEQCLHLPYEMVELPSGAMSSRKGNVIPLALLIKNMEEKIFSDYLKKYLDSGEWVEREVASTTSMIANGAIKYGMIKMDTNRKIVFDMNEWIKLDGDTGPYLQYVCVRIRSLLVKLDFDSRREVVWEELSGAEEVSLMVKLSLFNRVVLRCAEQYKTAPLCSYLYELGKLFNSFYTACPISGAKSEKLRDARLSLAHATGKVMGHGLKLLGIPTPSRM